VPAAGEPPHQLLVNELLLLPGTPRNQRTNMTFRARTESGGGK
jgi:hypothetical protein